MRIAVIVAMDEEIGLLKKSIDFVRVDTVAGIQIYTGRYQAHQLFVAQSGIGKVQAGMVATILCNNYFPEVIVNTGSAGGIGADLQIGDVVISTAVAYHDVDVTSSGYEYGQLPQQPRFFEADGELVKKIDAAAQIVGQTTHQGLIVSGDQFLNSSQAVARILQQFPQALASDMEGAAMGQVATQFKIPFVVIRAISDVGDENSEASFAEFVRDAGERSVQTLIDFLDHNE